MDFVRKWLITHLLEVFYLGLSHDPNDIKFLLYATPSDKNQSEELVYKNQNSLRDSLFRSEYKTVILIHGFWSDGQSHFPTEVKDAYLEKMESNQTNANFIIVDWGLLSRSQSPSLLENLIYPLIYPLVVKENIPIVSQRVADFIQFLIEIKATRLEDIHIIGHSLGSHISGYVGHLLKMKNEGEKARRISGLDPAGPLFDKEVGGVKVQRGLRKEDAQFVDVYHTAMGTRGDTTLDGHVDFYPNGGVVQPPCPMDRSTSAADPFGQGSCSHKFVVDIYAATIQGNITGCKCSVGLPTTEFRSCWLNCPDPVFVGDPCPSETRGQYYFETRNDY